MTTPTWSMVPSGWSPHGTILCYEHLFWMLRDVSTQKASCTSGQHHNGLCPLPDVLQQVPTMNSWCISTRSSRWWLSHPSGTSSVLIKLCSLNKRTKLFTENHHILHYFPCIFASPKLEVTTLTWKIERQILFPFNPTSKMWMSTVICKSPFPLCPKLEGCIYLHHPEYPDHNLPSAKPGQRGDDPCRQQDAEGSAHAMNEKKTIISYD